MNSNMAKPEKFGHLPLVYHFKVPLIKLFHIGAKKSTHRGNSYPLASIGIWPGILQVVLNPC